MAETDFEDQGRYEEEDREYRARYERRQRIRQERQRRMRRRRILRRALLLGMLAAVVLTVSVMKFGRKPGEDAVMPQKQEVEAMDQPDRPVTEQITDDMEEPRNTATEESGEEVPVYQFTQAEDMAVIDSEEVISTHAILVDESKDTIVASKGAGERIMPASMTKVLTILVAAEQILSLIHI